MCNERCEAAVIDEAVSVTLHSDRAGCEWFIVTSKDHPDSESEVTPSDDPALFDLLKSITAAQQQEQAVCECPHQDMNEPPQHHDPHCPGRKQGQAVACAHCGGPRDSAMHSFSDRYLEAQGMYHEFVPSTAQHREPKS